MEIRDAMASSEDAALLDKCERGEGYLLKRFTTVLDEADTRQELVPMLRELMSRVQVSLSTIKQLHATALEGQ